VKLPTLTGLALLLAATTFSGLAGCGGGAAPTGGNGSSGGKNGDDDDDDDDDDDGRVFADAVVDISWDTYLRTDVRAFRIFYAPDDADPSEKTLLGEVTVAAEGFDLQAPSASFATSDDEDLAKRMGKVTCFTIVAVGNDNSESPASTERCLDLEF
jgi:hypothetical protein